MNDRADLRGEDCLQDERFVPQITQTFHPHLSVLHRSMRLDRFEL